MNATTSFEIYDELSIQYTITIYYNIIKDSMLVVIYIIYNMYYILFKKEKTSFH